MFCATLVPAFLSGCGESGDRDTFTVPLPDWRSAGAPRLSEKDNPSDARSADQITDDSRLLATEADRRGLAKSYGVQRALRIAVAQILIDETFRPTTDAAKLTDDELKMAYDRNRWVFNSPPFVSLAHILFRMDDKTKRAERVALGKKLCAEALVLAKQVKSADAFRALKKKFEGRGLPLVLEEFRTWPGKMEQAFEDAAFKLRTPGEVSECVTTNYGSHIIYLHKYEPAVERPLATVKDEVRQKSAAEFATQKFVLWMKRLRANHRAERVPDVIARLRKEPTK